MSKPLIQTPPLSASIILLARFRRPEPAARVLLRLPTVVSLFLLRKRWAGGSVPGGRCEPVRADGPSIACHHLAAPALHGGEVYVFLHILSRRQLLQAGGHKNVSAGPVPNPPMAPTIQICSLYSCSMLFIAFKSSMLASSFSTQFGICKIWNLRTSRLMLHSVHMST